jgi:small subunit ribosomal protein S1
MPTSHDDKEDAEKQPKGIPGDSSEESKDDKKRKGKKLKTASKSVKEDDLTEEKQEDTSDFEKEIDDFDEFSDDTIDLESLYFDTFKNIEEGNVIKGTILHITPNEVLVDIGYKSEGVIPRDEFKDLNIDDKLKIGDEIDVYLESKEDIEGRVVLSKEKADKIKIWDEVQKAYDEDTIISGMIVDRIKGGFAVDIGIRAFLPGSQVDLRPIKDADNLLGQTIETKIIKLNRKRGNIVLSRRILLEDERKALREKTLEQIEEGKTLKGIVKNITEYGVFVDLGGIDGLLHITDISWGRVSHPSEYFMVGDPVEVVVLKYDSQNEKVSLGYKQKSRDPWETAAEKYPINSRVKGKIISIADYGAFIELETGVEGLVHISEMTWNGRIKHPSKLVAIGDIVEAVVLQIDPNNKRISMGMKQIEPNPWELIAEKYPLGAHITGVVRNLTEFGAFVELEEGIDGLIHISDMSWTKRVKKPSDLLRKGEDVDCIVLHIDPANERLSLGLKQAQPDPWEQIENDYQIGQNVKVTTTKIVDFGIFVELDEGIEGLIHVSELDPQKADNFKDHYKIDDSFTAKIIKLDINDRKISLSERDYLSEISIAGFEDIIQSENLDQDIKESKNPRSRKDRDRSKKSDPEY